MRTQKTFRRKARVNANIRLLYSVSRGGVVNIYIYFCFVCSFSFLNKSQTGEMEPMESFFFIPTHTCRNNFLLLYSRHLNEEQSSTSLKTLHL